jgi:hypothetical protein
VLVHIARALSAVEGIAGFGDEALALAPVESTCHIATLAAVVALITADDLLG